ncbi:MAG: glycosyltransferase [Lachnospiraceae bacterium]|nr:glycosyltransferase [Lachnospiraceae bacterium]MBQ8947924.1 glycosyltransferase [Lachnospiraceae bacterium]
MAFEEYTWERYYEDIFRRQKKYNNNLAVQIGEKDSKTAELQAQLDRVTGSTYWKLLAPVRKLYSGLKGTGKQIPQPDASVDTADEDLSTLYEERKWHFEDYYAGWIAKDDTENNYTSYRNSGMTRIRESGFHIINIEDCKGIKVPFDLEEASKWLLFVSAAGQLATGYADRIGAELAEHPGAVIAYADEDWYYNVSGGIHRIEPNFKPDWSPDTLDSFFYFGNIALIRTDFAVRAHWLGSSDPYANIYDLFLQASDSLGKHITEPGVLHISQVLYHNDGNKYVDTSRFGDADSGRNDCYSLWKSTCTRLKEDLENGRLTWGAEAKYNGIKRRSFDRRQVKAGFIDSQDGITKHILYKTDVEPLVSVLILTRDHPEVLEKLLFSFAERTDYTNLEFVIVDNGSTAEHRTDYENLTDRILSEFPHKYIYEPRDFNFSALCNTAASHAAGDLLLFMNDDIEVVQKDWLRLMAGYAVQPHIGAVGAKLLYADTDLIQHVGITSMEIGPSHKLVIFPDDVQYYYGKNVFQTDVLGVTAACLMISAQKFRQVGGFDESFPVAYNDVELSFRITGAGFVNLQCNGALLYHHESLTRGKDEGDGDKWDRLLNEKKRLYQIHPEFYGYDPYYNCNLIGNESNYLSNCDFGYNKSTRCEVIRQNDERNLAEIPGDEYRISVDFAGLHSKLNLEEPEIIEIRGWLYMPGRDNGLLGCDPVLKNITSGIVYELKSYAMPRQDLEAAFPNERNIGLCGFVGRALKDDLTAGKYRIGIKPKRLKHDLIEWETSKNVIFTANTITV